MEQYENPHRVIYYYYYFIKMTARISIFIDSTLGPTYVSIVDFIVQTGACTNRRKIIFCHLASRAMEFCEYCDLKRIRNLVIPEKMFAK